MEAIFGTDDRGMELRKVVHIQRLVHTYQREKYINDFSTDH